MNVQIKNPVTIPMFLCNTSFKFEREKLRHKKNKESEGQTAVPVHDYTKPLPVLEPLNFSRLAMDHKTKNKIK